jgi:hypothetical protein
MPTSNALHYGTILPAPAPTVTMSLNAPAKAAVSSLVGEFMTGIIRESIAVQRHCKRARLHESEDDARAIRRRLHASDINMALQLLKSEKLYATGVTPPNVNDKNKRVKLKDFLATEVLPLPPNEVSIKVHWLAVDGTQPQIPQNPSETKAPQPASAINDETPTDVQVHRLQSSLLSEELQLYFTRVTLATDSTTPAHWQDAVLASLAHDPGLQELVPFLVRYCQQELYRHVTSGQSCGRIFVRLVQSILSNPQLHIELHVQQLLPALLTCVVAPSSRTQHQKYDHHALRRDAAAALHRICKLFGDSYATLQARVLRALCAAIAPNKSLSSRYGGIVATSMFGAKAVDAFLLPHLMDSWNEWEQCLETTTHDTPMVTTSTTFELQMCQRAVMDALSIYLQSGVSTEEMMERFDWEDMEETLGDRYVPFMGEETDYSVCFV